MADELLRHSSSWYILLILTLLLKCFQSLSVNCQLLSIDLLSSLVLGRLAMLLENLLAHEALVACLALELSCKHLWLFTLFLADTSVDYDGGIFFFRQTYESLLARR